MSGENTGLIFDTDSFKWSRDEYSLKELLDRFGHQMPFVMVVTQGYSGKEDIGADELYYVHDLVKQPRVVGKDPNDDYFSIPFCCQKKVIPTTAKGKESPAMSVAEMARKNTFQYFQFPEGTNHTVMRDAAELATIELDRMELTRTYDERFLVVHSVLSAPARQPMSRYDSGPSHYIKGGVHPQFYLMPVYMPISIAVAVEVTEKTNENFHRLMFDFNAYVNSQPHYYDKALQAMADIIVFDEEPSNGDYEYIHFMQMVNSTDPKSQDYGYMIPEHKNRISNVYTAIGEAPARPPKPNFKAAANPKGLLAQHRRPKNKRKPPPEPEKQLGSQITKKSDNPSEIMYSSPTRTKLANRVGQVAMDLDPAMVLKTLQRVLQSESAPKSTKKVIIEKSKKERKPEEKHLFYGQPPQIPVRQSTGKRGESQPTVAVVSPHTQQDLEPPDTPIKPHIKPQYVTKVLTALMSDVSQIPTDISMFTVGDVAKCIDLLNMSQCTQTFIKHQVDGELLKDLDEQILREQFGLDALRAKKVIKFVNGWRPKLQ